MQSEKSLFSSPRGSLIYSLCTSSPFHYYRTLLITIYGLVQQTSSYTHGGFSGLRQRKLQFSF